MPETSSLGLPLLVAEQAQKHVTHNEALTALDAIVQLSVIDRDLTAPPGSPSDGDRYLVGAGATDEWADHDDEVAAWQDGAWSFHAPQAGWRCWVEDESVLLIWTGSAWSDLSLLIAVLQNLALLGIGTTADATNPLSAKLNNVLWTAKYDAEGGDGTLRYKMNKEAAEDTLSLLLQTDYSGRAEIGLIGDDDLLFKVSPDGATWYEALRIDKDSGALDVIETITSNLDDDGSVFTHDDGNTGGEGVLFKWSYNPIDWTNGPGGEENYTDYTWQLGFNTEGGGVLEAGKPALYLQWESKYYAGVFASEFHLQHFNDTADGFRPLSFFLPITGTAGSIATMRGDTIHFYDQAGNLYYEMVAGSGIISTPLTLNKSTNNTRFIKQLSSIGSYLDLLWLDSTDIGRIGVPLRIGGAMPSSNTFIQIDAPTGVTSGQKLMTIASPTITGTVEGLRITGSPTTGLFQQIFNGDTVNGTAFARLQIGVGGANGGDPHIYFAVTGVTSYAVGIDNSDGDKWKLCKASSPSGGNERIAVDDNAVAFGVPARLPGYTVATVPSAAGAGAGAMIYVSDETGGAVPAFSDGTDWRRVTDRAPVS